MAPLELPASGKVERAGYIYPVTRRFRFAVPNLRLKSGVRFDLANSVEGSEMNWSVSLYFGSSQAISQMTLHKKLLEKVVSKIPARLTDLVEMELNSLSRGYKRLRFFQASAGLVARASLRTCGNPFKLLDRIGDSGGVLTQLFEQCPPDVESAVVAAIASQFRQGKGQPKVVGVDKLSRHAPLILAGILVGAMTNIVLASNAGTQYRGKVSSKAAALNLGSDGHQGFHAGRDFLDG